MTKAEFKKLVENGPVILDGATGTNLQKAGMPVGVCPEQWILENPDIMIKLQEDYVAAGTNILYAPTFTANRIKLEEYGLADKLEEMNRELIALSKKAAQGKALAQRGHGAGGGGRVLHDVCADSACHYNGAADLLRHGGAPARG